VHGFHDARRIPMSTYDDELENEERDDDEGGGAGLAGGGSIAETTGDAFDDDELEETAKDMGRAPVEKDDED
jgi:hypothetical protein